MTTWIEFTLGVHIKLPKSKLERDFKKIALCLSCMVLNMTHRFD